MKHLEPWSTHARQAAYCAAPIVPYTSTSSFDKVLRNTVLPIYKPQTLSTRIRIIITHYAREQNYYPPRLFNTIRFDSGSTPIYRHMRHYLVMYSPRRVHAASVCAQPPFFIYIMSCGRVMAPLWYIRAYSAVRRDL